MIKKCTRCGKEYEATGKIDTMFTQDFPCDECCAKIVAERKKNMKSSGGRLSKASNVEKLEDIDG